MEHTLQKTKDVPGRLAGDNFSVRIAVTSLLRMLRRFTESKGGATAIEYGLIAALISLVIIISITTIGTEMNDTFYGPIGQTLDNAQSN